MNIATRHPQTERRKFERFKLNFCVRSIDISAAQDIDCVTNDISAKGMGLISREQLTAGHSLDLWLTMPDNGERIHTRGKVVWSRMVGLQRYKAGIELYNQDLSPNLLGLRMLRLRLLLEY